MKSMAELLKKLTRQAEEDGIQDLVTGTIITNPQHEVLMVQRAPKDDFLPGIAEIPGGGVESGESVEATLKREAREEVGFNVTGIERYVDLFDYVGQSGRRKRQLNFHVRGKFGQEGVRLSEEHTDYFWADQARAEDSSASPEVKATLRRFWGKK